MRGLGLLIREQTKNLQWLGLYRVICTDEEDLVYLIECCRHVKKMSELRLYYGGTREGGRLESHLKGLHASGGDLSVWVIHVGTAPRYVHCTLSLFLIFIRIMTAMMLILFCILFLIFNF
eukprot:XP_011670123.1 PREDICTED: uncharacterized protein LOC105439897 [Strongylocentrotus purpuratus]